MVTLNMLTLIMHFLKKKTHRIVLNLVLTRSHVSEESSDSCGCLGETLQQGRGF